MLFCRIYVIWGLATIKNNIGTKLSSSLANICHEFDNYKNNIDTKLYGIFTCFRLKFGNYKK